MSNSALIVIDIQNEYFEDGGMELVDPLKAGKNARRVIDQFRRRKLPVVHIQHISSDPKAMPFFIDGRRAAEIHESVSPMPNELVIRKHFPNSFRETELLDYLRKNKIEELVVVGMMTHMCIDATVRAAVDLGFPCTVIDDACATRDLEINGSVVGALEVQHAFLAALAFFYAEVQDTETYLERH